MDKISSKEEVRDSARKPKNSAQKPPDFVKIEALLDEVKNGSLKEDEYHKRINNFKKENFLLYIQFGIDKVVKCVEAKPRKDRIHAYVDYSDKLKRRTQQLIGDLELLEHPKAKDFLDKYKEIKGEVESEQEKALEKALKGKDSLFHRYAMLSPVYHDIRKAGEEELKKSISLMDDLHKFLVNECQKPGVVDKIIEDNTCKELKEKYYDSGKKYLEVGRHNEARDDFTRVITLDENHASAFARRGSAYLAMKQYKEAEADFNRALKLDKDNIYALAHRGIMHQKKGQYEEAWDDFKRARDLGSKLGKSWPWIDDELEKLRRRK